MQLSPFKFTWNSQDHYIYWVQEITDTFVDYKLPDGKACILHRHCASGRCFLSECKPSLYEPDRCNPFIQNCGQNLMCHGRAHFCFKDGMDNLTLYNISNSQCYYSRHCNMLEYCDKDSFNELGSCKPAPSLNAQCKTVCQDGLACSESTCHRRCVEGHIDCPNNFNCVDSDSNYFSYCKAADGISSQLLTSSLQSENEKSKLPYFALSNSDANYVQDNAGGIKSFTGHNIPLYSLKIGGSCLANNTCESGYCNDGKCSVPEVNSPCRVTYPDVCPLNYRCHPLLHRCLPPEFKRDIDLDDYECDLTHPCHPDAHCIKLDSNQFRCVESMGISDLCDSHTPCMDGMVCLAKNGQTEGFCRQLCNEQSPVCYYNTHKCVYLKQHQINVCLPIHLQKVDNFTVFSYDPTIVSKEIEDEKARLLAAQEQQKKEEQELSNIRHFERLPMPDVHSSEDEEEANKSSSDEDLSRGGDKIRGYGWGGDTSREEIHTQNPLHHSASTFGRNSSDEEEAEDDGPLWPYGLAALVLVALLVIGALWVLRKRRRRPTRMSYDMQPASAATAAVPEVTPAIDAAFKAHLKPPGAQEYYLMPYGAAPSWGAHRAPPADDGDARLQPPSFEELWAAGLIDFGEEPPQFDDAVLQPDWVTDGAQTDTALTEAQRENVQTDFAPSDPPGQNSQTGQP